MDHQDDNIENNNNWFDSTEKASALNKSFVRTKPTTFHEEEHASNKQQRNKRRHHTHHLLISSKTRANKSTVDLLLTKTKQIKKCRDNNNTIAIFVK